MKTAGLKENIEKLRSQGLTYNEIVKKLNCAKSTVSYYCKNDKPKKQKEIKQKRVKLLDVKKDAIKITCLICECVFETKRASQKTCSKECRREFKKQYLKSRNYEYINLISWRQKQKKLAITYKGGKCVVCNYNKCDAALEFHHTNPDEKDFSISHNKNVSFEKMKNELDKCVLVCSNCHREIHEEINKINVSVAERI